MKRRCFGCWWSYPQVGGGGVVCWVLACDSVGRPFVLAAGDGGRCLGGWWGLCVLVRFFGEETVLISGVGASL